MYCAQAQICFNAKTDGQTDRQTGQTYIRRVFEMVKIRSKVRAHFISQACCMNISEETETEMLIVVTVFFHKMVPRAQ